MALLFVLFIISLFNSKIIQCGSFHRSEAHELGESLLDYISKARLVDLPKETFDAKYECNYAFNIRVELKSAKSKYLKEYTWTFFLIINIFE